MPCYCQIFEELDLLFVRHVGRTQTRDQQVAMQALLDNPAYHSGMRLLVDTSAVTSTEIDLLSLITRRNQHREQLEPLKHTTRWGYFAPNDLSYGLCRRAQIAFEDLPNLEIGVFRTVQETLAFLDLPLEGIPAWPAYSPEQS